MSTPGDESAERDLTLYLAGLAAFERGEHFEAHEHLEDLWLRNRSPIRPFLQGLIQLAAACHHIGRRNQRAALQLLAESEARLAPFAPGTLRLDVAALLLAIRRCRRHAEDLGPDDIVSFDPALLPRPVHGVPPLSEFWPHRGTVAAPLPRRSGHA